MEYFWNNTGHFFHDSWQTTTDKRSTIFLHLHVKTEAVQTQEVKKQLLDTTSAFILFCI